jgi:aminopeptidase N
LSLFIDFSIVFCFSGLGEQLKQLQADHADELGTAARALDQSIERAESNVEWMSLHYQEVLDWIQQNP